MAFVEIIIRSLTVKLLGGVQQSAKKADPRFCGHGALSNSFAPSQSGLSRSSQSSSNSSRSTRRADLMKLSTVTEINLVIDLETTGVDLEQIFQFLWVRIPTYPLKPIEI